MSVWIRYAWTDFDPNDLPWARDTAVPAVPGRVSADSRWLRDPESEPVPFDPLRVYSVVLNREWKRHQNGASVKVDGDQIDIETGE